MPDPSHLFYSLSNRLHRSQGLNSSKTLLGCRDLQGSSVHQRHQPQAAGIPKKPKDASSSQKAEDVPRPWFSFLLLFFILKFQRVCIFKKQWHIIGKSIILRRNYHCKKAAACQRNALAVIQIHLNGDRHRHQRPSSEQANPPMEHKHSITLQSNSTE